MKVLGIDPGNNGALAYYDGDELLIWDMPIFKKEKGYDLDIHKLSLFISEAGADQIFLEKNVAMPKFSGKVCYAMGKSEGAILGVAASKNVSYTLVRPSIWKKAMSCPADKDAARQRASQLLPQYAHNWDLKKHDGRAEAALIALFGYNKMKV